MPWYSYAAEHCRLADGRDRAYNLASNSNEATAMTAGYYAAVGKLAAGHCQAPGIGAYLSRIGVGPQAAALVGIGPGGAEAGTEDKGTASGAETPAMLYKAHGAARQREDIRKMVELELVKNQARLDVEAEQLRQDLASFLGDKQKEATYAAKVAARTSK